jgi:DNA-binding NarL/FixJ family response regulator
LTTVLDLVASFLLVVERNASPLYAEELTRSGRYRPIGRTDSMSAALDTVHRMRPDVVLADIATAERLHHVVAAIRGMAGTPVVVVSGLPAEVALLPTMAAGARAFLQKPVEAEALERTVAWVLDGHTVVDPRCTHSLVELALHGHATRPDNGLTLRQSQVVALVRGGLTNRQIGRVLGLSGETVKTHLHDAMKRLGAADRWAATALADRQRHQDAPTSGGPT